MSNLTISIIESKTIKIGILKSNFIHCYQIRISCN